MRRRCTAAWLMVRAFGVAIDAFGIALAGLILPAAFAALSSVSPGTGAMRSSARYAKLGREP